jgi:hypothetical protein
VLGMQQSFEKAAEQFGQPAAKLMAVRPAVTA